ncbi:cytochrome c oxidase protein 20 homolog isoform X1 [Trichechus manatus latirostris]|uniref:Cytochrome c oxidase assembly protein COX20, mitochondrial n=1 Tax=Trichechus manatus latirostris TaxID=127582 RepID=A0A2Y9R4T5_TRIMA|nr:cytochrome c oxidase protein 20 homolog isoform X1 [Trichechus manatus latirostris]
MADAAQGRGGGEAGTAPADCTSSALRWGTGTARMVRRGFPLWAVLGGSRTGPAARLVPMAAEREPGEPGKGKPFKLLGILDVENIPCARDSVLYGSLGSVVAGLGHFLLTSEYTFYFCVLTFFSRWSNYNYDSYHYLTGRIRRSCDVGVGGFILVTLGCWLHCRYNYAKLRIQERIAREGIKNKILYESTHLDPQRKQTDRNSSN